MKTEILSIDGKKIKDIDLPSLFSEKIREDIVQKTFEAEKIIQPYSPELEAGKKHSASGVIRHIRHKWRSHYGRGISRIPRKTMWRRGTQFYWIGAEVSGTRGGRRAHPPKIAHFLKNKKINKKEYNIALTSAISSTAKEDLVKRRYKRISDNSKIEIGKLPIVVESKITELKTGQLNASLKKILGNLSSLKLLIITGNNEKIKTKFVESKKVDDIELKDLYPLGRLTVYTENAIKDLENLNKISVKEKGK
ncbi:50S ribosomal protein L4 [Candidatus Pacearchaeota archaeon]|nr:50S ribosomal protein L4 [Candidatus Pacearchaeota archaeon]